MVMKKFLGLTLLVVLMFSAFVSASALDELRWEQEYMHERGRKVLVVDRIEVEGTDVLEFHPENRPVIDLNRGEELEVEVTLMNKMTDVEDEEVWDPIEGWETQYVDIDVEDATMYVSFWYEDAEEEGTMDRVEVDLDAGASDSYTAKLKLPKDMPQEEAQLYIEVRDKSGQVWLMSHVFDPMYEEPDDDWYEYGEWVYLNDFFDGGIPLTIRAQSEHLIDIKDIMLHPESRVTAGDLLTAQVRLENIGEVDIEEDDVKVTARVLGLDDAMDSTYLLKELEYEDEASTEPLSFYIPLCAKPGEYTLEVTVEYDDGDEKQTAERKITVVGSCSDMCADKAQSGETSVNIISGMQVLSESQKMATFPVVITNNADTSKAFVVSADALGDWASEVKVQETSVVIDAGKQKTVLVLATAKDDAQAGKQLVSIKVKDSEGNTVQEEAAELSIAGSTGGFGKMSFRRVLEVGLIVLVILLVLLGLIIGFNKLKEDEEDLEEEDKSYY